MDTIFEALKVGSKFSFSLLASEFESTEAYWDWWWSNCAQYDKIVRPELISDDDPILIETIKKSDFSECEHSFLLAEYFRDWMQTCSRRCRIDHGSRVELHGEIVKALLTCVTSDGGPHVIFCGGGYGAGKTSTMLSLLDQGWHNLPKRGALGVDRCKQLIPEFSYLQNISDGRASATTQREAVHISELLFREAIQLRRNFIWDSSMSNKESTLEKISMCRQNGYSIRMVGILAQRDKAIRRAMARSFEIRRFPHPVALPKSHVDFLNNLDDLAPLFDEAHIYDNTDDDADSGLIAQQTGEKGLDVLNAPRLHEVRSSWSI